MENYIYQFNYDSKTMDNPYKELLSSFTKRKGITTTVISEQIAKGKEWFDNLISNAKSQAMVNIPDYFIGTETEWAAFVAHTKWEAVLHDFLTNGGQTEISQLANDLFTLFREDVMTDSQSVVTISVTGSDHKVQTHDERMNLGFIEGLKHEIKNSTTRIRVELGMLTKQHAGNYTSNAYLEAIVKAWHAKVTVDPVLKDVIAPMKTIFADAKLHNILDYYRTKSSINSVEAHIKSMLVSEILK